MALKSEMTSHSSKIVSMYLVILAYFDGAGYDNKTIHYLFEEGHCKIEKIM